MTTLSSLRFPAHSCTHEQPPQERGGTGDNCAARPEDAAEYIAGLLASLRDMAANAHLDLLSDLLSVAEEEARLNSRA